MSLWQQWVRMLAGLVLFTAFFDLLLPENDSKKLAKLIMGLVIVAAMLQPVLTMVASNWDSTIIALGTAGPSWTPNHDVTYPGAEIQFAGMEPMWPLISSSAAAQLEALLISSESIENAQVIITLAEDGSVSQVQVAIWPVSASDQLPLAKQLTLREWAVKVAARYLQIDQSVIYVEMV
ncbi:MAG: stage III sporulation protein AF [Firmicutes bacterium]|jgi:stage III sporulation protein AF|nr:stage III sporulation protein AF [Bacillota bacterium]NLL88884.1 stage III sporulation protein AF [Bacillota bacterium]